jgi:SAM-dependent methyltransferase
MLMRADLGRLLPLMMEAARRPFEGTVLTLGRMNLHFGAGNVRQAARRFGVTLADAEVAPSEFAPAARIGGISDRSYLRLLGFAESKVLDLAECERPDYRVDLNGDVPSELAGRFDCIIDPGTLEHVFDASRALRNIAAMLRPGGRVLHLSAPASNNVDHGFYCFSPSFFHDFYATNAFEVNAVYLVRARYGRLRSTWDLFAYRPGALRHIQGGDLGSGHWLIFCVATKTPASTCDRAPQQDRAAHGWGVEPAGAARRRPIASRIVRGVLRRAIHRRPRLALPLVRRLVMSGRIR